MHLLWLLIINCCLSYTDFYNYMKQHCPRISNCSLTALCSFNFITLCYDVWLNTTRHTCRSGSLRPTRRVVALTVAYPTGQRHYWFVLELPAGELASGASRVAMWLTLWNVLEAWARDYYVTQVRITHAPVMTR